MKEEERHYALINLFKKYTTTHSDPVHDFVFRLSEVGNYFDSVDKLRHVLKEIKIMTVPEEGMAVKQGVIKDFKELADGISFKVFGVTTEKLDNYKKWLDTYKLDGNSNNPPNKIIVETGPNSDYFLMLYQNKKLKIKRGRHDSANYLNICLLLFGLPLSYICGSDTEILNGKRPDIFDEEKNYIIGETKLDYDIIYQYAIINNVTGVENSTRAEKNKKIYDGIRYINRMARSKFHFKILENSRSECWVREDVARKLIKRDSNN